MDGAGDVYIADNNRNQVVEVPAGCTSSGCQIYNTFGLNSQLGVAVDGAGDLFVSSYNDHEVVEQPANGGAQTAVYSPGGSSNPIGLTIDAAGDLFKPGREIADDIEAFCRSAQIGVGEMAPVCDREVGARHFQRDDADAGIAGAAISAAAK